MVVWRHLVKNAIDFDGYWIQVDMTDKSLFLAIDQLFTIQKQMVNGQEYTIPRQSP